MGRRNRGKDDDARSARATDPVSEAGAAPPRNLGLRHGTHAVTPAWHHANRGEGGCRYCRLRAARRRSCAGWFGRRSASCKTARQLSTRKWPDLHVRRRHPCRPHTKRSKTLATWRGGRLAAAEASAGTFTKLPAEHVEVANAPRGDTPDTPAVINALYPTTLDSANFSLGEVFPVGGRRDVRDRGRSGSAASVPLGWALT